jgi:hypothetical protein
MTANPKHEPAENTAVAIRSRATLELGDRLAALKADGQLHAGQPRKNRSEAEQFSEPTLADLGIDRKLSMRAQRMAELPRQETLDEKPRPRWGEETLGRIAAVYESERAKQGGPVAAWADLPIETRLVLIGVYCAGRVDGGR